MSRFAGVRARRRNPERFLRGNFLAFSGFSLDGLKSRSIQLLFARPSRPLAVTQQRLPRLLRLLLMYQDNPNRASSGRNFFRQNRTCPADTAFCAGSRAFCAAQPTAAQTNPSRRTCLYGVSYMEFPKAVGLETIRAKSCGQGSTHHSLPPLFQCFNASSPGWRKEITYRPTPGK